MKNIVLLSLFLVLFSFSCDDLTDLNKNIKDPQSIGGDPLFTSGQKNLVDQMVTPSVNDNTLRLIMQYWTQTTYTDETNYNLIARNIPTSFWNELYRRALKNFLESYTIIEATKPEPGSTADKVKNNKMAITEIMSVYTYSVLVDVFGDVPYSKALNPDDLLPAYDDGLTIYKDLITRLDAAIGNLDSSAGSFGAADNMYHGNVANWAKFAQSLKLRMGITLSDVDNVLARSTVEQAAPNVFTGVADNAALAYASTSPNFNPIHEQLVSSGRTDYVASATIIDQMDELNDPRKELYFDPAPNIGYTGAPVGEVNTYANYARPSKGVVTQATALGVLLSYAEVEFLLAEAIERGFAVGGTAEGHYDAAITASITSWGSTVDAAAAYLAQPAVAYATAQGDWKQKIGSQKWLALYNRGYAAWLSWRLLDYPVLPDPARKITDTPVRFTYPVSEETRNPGSFKAAAAAIGGNSVVTKLFWDMN